MVADTDHVKCVKLRTDLSPLLSPSSRRTDKGQVQEDVDDKMFFIMDTNKSLYKEI